MQSWEFDGIVENEVLKKRYVALNSRFQSYLQTAGSDVEDRSYQGKQEWTEKMDQVKVSYVHMRLLLCI